MLQDLREINWLAFMRWIGWKIIQIFCVFLCYWVCYTLSGELGLVGVQRAVFTTFTGSGGLCFLQRDPDHFPVRAEEHPRHVICPVCADRVL